MLSGHAQADSLVLITDPRVLSVEKKHPNTIYGSNPFK